MTTSYPFNSFTPRQLYTELTNMVLCCIILVWFLNDSPLQAETCSKL